MSCYKCGCYHSCAHAHTYEYEQFLQMTSLGSAFCRFLLFSTRATLFVLWLVFFVCFYIFVLGCYELLVPVQLIAWKDFCRFVSRVKVLTVHLHMLLLFISL